MRPKKDPDELRDVSIIVRLTAAEAESFRAQARFHSKGLSEYLRDMARRDGEDLLSNGKIRRTEAGWEILRMGEWKTVRK